MANAIEIGPLAANDLSELGRLYSQLIPHKADVEKMATVLDSLDANPNHIVLGAKVNGTLVGSAVGVMCGLLFGKCRPFMVVEDVVVDQSERQKGIGRALMLEIEEWAKSRDCAYIILLTDHDRHVAQSFYESIGYTTEPYRGYRKTLASNV